MESFVLQSRLAQFVRDTIKGVYTGAQQSQRIDKLPVYAVETITFDATIVTDDGINYAFSESLDLNPESITTERVPEIRQVTTRTAIDTGKTLSTDEGKDLSTATQEGTDESRDSSSSRTSSTQQDNSSDQQTTIQERGTEELTTDQSYT